MLITDEKSEGSDYTDQALRDASNPHEQYIPLIARPEPSPRLFPPVSPTLYDQARSDDSSAAYTQRLTKWLLSLGQLAPARRAPWSKPTPIAWLGDLLWLHRYGLESELAGRFEQADLFWRACYRDLLLLARQPVPLAQLFDQLAMAAVPPSADDLVAPGLLLRAFVDEILIDTHCALYNGWARQAVPRWNSRAFVHSAYLRQILEVASQHEILTPAELVIYRGSLLIPALEAEIRTQILAERWNPAVEIGRLLIQHQPIPRCAAELAVCALVGGTLSLIIRERERSHSGYLRDAQRLRASLTPLEQLQQIAPGSVHIPLLLGRVYALAAIRLAQAQAGEEARLLLDRALGYSPELAESTPVQALIAVCTSDQPVHKGALAGLAHAATKMAEDLWAWVQRIADRTRLGSAPSNSPAVAPVLASAGRSWQRHMFGLGIWFRSPADGLLKAALATMMILVILVGGLTLVEQRARAIRDTAYADLRQAVARSDNHAVLVHAEAFFANQPLGRPDMRSQLVHTLYSQSFVDWFRTSYASPPADFQERVDRYSALADR